MGTMKDSHQATGRHRPFLLMSVHQASVRALDKCADLIFQNSTRGSHSVFMKLTGLA